MSAELRDVIAQTISEHRLWNGRCESCGETSTHESRHMADAVLDILKRAGQP